MNRVRLIQNFIIIASGNKNSFKRRKVTTAIRQLRFIILPFTFIMVMACSCNQMGKRPLNETPTRGKIRISVDESFQPIIEAEIFTFTHLYTSASVTAQYEPEVDVINDFMNDSVKVIVSSKKLTDYQVQYLRDSQIIARTTTFAYDALALVTNKNNSDSLLKYNTIKDIFQGKITKWQQISQKSKLGDIRVIFDNNKSGNIRYFKELFETDSLGSNFFAVNSNPEVINFVSRNEDALGIISVNWISDKDDSTAREYLNKVNIVAVSHQFLDDGYYYRPLQGSIYNKEYPFVRDVYLISRETFAGLGSGFINWLCAEQGQKIVLKSGLVPATMPIRLVQVKQE
ncbi:MAG TPA: substrate-binding domain-containing protein [Bacteroidales bacterium]|nr:substrate-binding domain-containing protein [Bacteroidales bacterium]